MASKHTAVDDSPVGHADDSKDLEINEIEKIDTLGPPVASEIDVVAEKKLIRKVRLVSQPLT